MVAAPRHGHAADRPTPGLYSPPRDVQNNRRAAGNHVANGGDQVQAIDGYAVLGRGRKRSDSGQRGGLLASSRVARELADCPRWSCSPSLAAFAAAEVEVGEVLALFPDLACFVRLQASSSVARELAG